MKSKRDMATRCTTKGIPHVRHIAALALSFAVTGAAWANAAPPVQPSPANAKPAAVSSGKAGASKSSSWNKLTPAQREALAPLANDWNQLDGFRKKKWLELADRYAAMSPTEQERMQKRMQAWVRLSPEQRRIARENYARVKKLHAKQKSEQWEQYQQLPEEKKKELAASPAKKHPVAKPSHAPQSAAPASSPAQTPQSHPVPVQSSPSVP